MRIDELNKSCCGCTACQSICPKECIRMTTDEEGFIYPTINESMCIHCHQCEKVCPVLNIQTYDTLNERAYVVKDKRDEVRINATSGGIFTSIMEFVIGQGGVVYGVVVDTDKRIRHVRVESKSDTNFLKIPGSKYVKSDITGVLKKVKYDLEQGRFVCFSGTPCQVEGLKRYVGKSDKLITMDIVCHGNVSPYFWDKYVLWQEKKHHGKLVEARFRNKTYGYHSDTMKLIFDNGKTYHGSGRVDYYKKAFFEDLCSRPSCYDCKFKTVGRASDITAFDSWHASELADIFDDNMGFTNIIVHTDMGEKIIKKLPNIELTEVEIEKAIALDGIMMTNSVKWNKGREHFFIDLRKANDFEEFCKKYMHVSKKDRLIEWLKKFYYRKSMHP